jgi:hypothetical protein
VLIGRNGSDYLSLLFHDPRRPSSTPTIMVSPARRRTNYFRSSSPIPRADASKPNTMPMRASCSCRFICRLMCTKKRSLASTQYHRSRAPSLIARTVWLPLGGFPALPRAKPEVGRISRQFLFYLEVIPKACSRFSVERRGGGTTRRGQHLCEPALFIALWST